MAIQLIELNNSSKCFFHMEYHGRHKFPTVVTCLVALLFVINCYHYKIGALLELKTVIRTSLSVIPPTSSVNLAFLQPTWQSSTFHSSYSSAAVDGKKDTNRFNGFCSTTDNDASPWLAVDLGELTDVYGAAVTNRGDCCAGW